MADPSSLPTVPTDFGNGAYQPTPWRSIDPTILYDPTIRMDTPSRTVPYGLGEIHESLKEGLLEGLVFARPLARVAGNMYRQTQIPAEEGYLPIDDPQLQGYEPYLGWFYTSRSPRETALRIGELNRRLESQSRLPEWNMVGYLLGAVADPVFGAIAAPGRLVRGTPQLGTLYGGAALVSESVRQTLDPLQRDPSQLALAPVFGGVAGVAESLLVRVPRDIVTQAIERQRVYTETVEQAMGDLRQAQFQSLSSGATEPGRLSPSYAQRLQDEAAVTAFYLERLPNNPVKRVLQSSSVRARELVTELLELPLFQNKHLKGVPAVRSIERALQGHRATIADVMVETRRLYDAYAMEVLGRPLTMRERIAGNGPPMTFAEFRREVTIARMSGNQHPVKQVSEAARMVGEKIYAPLGKRGGESGVFLDEATTEFNGLQDALARGPDDKGRYTVSHGDNRYRLTEAELKKRIDRVQAGIDAMMAGNHRGTRADYVNLVFRRDRIKARRAEFEGLLIRTFKMEPETAAAVTDEILHQAPYQRLGPDSTGIASSIRSRDLFFKNEDVVRLLNKEAGDFIETDIFALGRYYMRTFGADLELYERFGSIDMIEQLDMVRDEYAALKAKADPARQAALDRQMQADLDDIRAMRDLIRGTYGLPADPNSGLSTAIRIFKRANAITMLTGAMAAVPDVGRVVMTEGLSRAFMPIFDGWRQGYAMFKLAKRDAQVAGEALDMLLSTRAALLADVSDGIGLAATFENVADRMADFTFSYVNLLNPWTDLMKSWTALVAGSRILDDILVLGRAAEEVPGAAPVAAKRTAATVDEVLDAYKAAGITGDPYFPTRVEKMTPEARADLLDRFDAEMARRPSRPNVAHTGKPANDNSRGPVLDPDSPEMLARFDIDPMDEVGRIKALHDWLKGMIAREGLGSDPNAIALWLSNHIDEIPEEIQDALMREATLDIMEPGHTPGYSGPLGILGDIRDNLGNSLEGLWSPQTIDRIMSWKGPSAMGGIGPSGYGPSRPKKVAINDNEPPPPPSPTPPRVLDRWAIARLARAGISKEMAERIAAQFKLYGQTEGRMRVARLDLWDDLKAKEAYADALARDVSRTIVTPGLGDPPLWMNTEWGGLIAQFKKFSTGAFERIAVSGLQERNVALMHGLVVMVGLGMLIDHIRSGQTGGEGETTKNLIMGGIDRSGVLGWAGDIVNAASTLLDPDVSTMRTAGTLFGPSGTQVANLTELFYGLTDGKGDSPTAHNVRRLLPWQNVFWADGVFDTVTGTP